MVGRPWLLRQGTTAKLLHLRKGENLEVAHVTLGSRLLYGSRETLEPCQSRLRMRAGQKL